MRVSVTAHVEDLNDGRLPAAPPPFLAHRPEVSVEPAAPPTVSQHPEAQRPDRESDSNEPHGARLPS